MAFNKNVVYPLLTVPHVKSILEYVLWMGVLRGLYIIILYLIIVETSKIIACLWLVYSDSQL